jgi:RNA polymerase sigma-70 factor (ECF subfamily)
VSRFKGLCYRVGMGDPESLEALMTRYVGGEAQAFDALYARTSQRVFSYQMMMTGDRTRAEDLCQTTFLKLHRARGGWIGSSPVMPWLMAIARNVFLDSARKRGRARVRVTTTGDLPDQVDQSSLRGPATGLKDAIDEAINGLPPRQREAFILTKHSGLSPREAARVLGISGTAIKLRVFRAHQALRAALKTYQAN